MSDHASLPPVPPLLPSAKRAPEPPQLPLGSDPEEQTPIRGVVAAIETILRQPRRVMFQLRQARAGWLIAALLGIAIVCMLVYGVVVGTFSGSRQLWAAPVKMGVGMLVAAFICLPSLYIFACLSGAQARLADVFGLVAGLLTLTTVLLIGFAPIAWIFSQSTESVPAMGALHLVFWAVATCFGLRFLGQGFYHLQARSRAGLNVWRVVFVLVVLQMTTALRPLVGQADTLLPTEKKFFLTHWMQCLEQGERAAPGDVEAATRSRR